MLNGLSLWTFVDVTAQRQFEAQRENDQQFSPTCDELPVGLFSAAHDGTLQYVNKTLASWLALGGDDPGLAPPLTLSDFLSLPATVGMILLTLKPTSLACTVG